MTFRATVFFVYYQCYCCTTLLLQGLSLQLVLLTTFQTTQLMRSVRTQVDHELSIPAVEKILISCAAWTASTATSLYFLNNLKHSRQHVLKACCLWGTLITDLVVSRK